MRRTRRIYEYERTHDIFIFKDGRWQRVVGLPLPKDNAEEYARSALFSAWAVEVREI